ncbi:DUF7344 domain-containing protein [Salinilacihabitans rarus]|uniref:DUF7344 domain-containing protein n=1 Tax=Salinilacihabitans rarus TaxID=2961596 RepID=UPI0020C89D8A|nr:hypothetical protein [Salinilacihabitans rarus]
MSSDAHGDSGGGDRGPASGPTRAECDVFGHSRRITVLQVLEAESTATVRELAGRIAARDVSRAVSDVTPAERRRVTISLVHDHLPRLVDHGAVEWDREAETVSLAADATPVDGSLLEAWATLDDEAFRTLAHPARLAVREVLAGAESTLSVDELARRLAARAGPPAGDADRLAVELHHAHLPAMAAAGLLDYDAAAGAVSARDPLSMPGQ